MSSTPIADYAMLSDRHSAALVSRDGSIDWLCMPRFDSGSVFARLLGDDGGYWSIRAADATETTRRYIDRTMVLETTFRTPSGVLTVVDALAMGEGNRGHELGKMHRTCWCAAQRALPEKWWSKSNIHPGPSTD